MLREVPLGSQGWAGADRRPLVHRVTETGKLNRQTEKSRWDRVPQGPHQSTEPQIRRVLADIPN